MVESINIENFKIFKKSKFSDFGRVNLLGGLNNSGKTTLLEALYLALSPSTNAVLSLKGLRREVFDKKMTEVAFNTVWDSLFYLHNKDNDIVIDTLIGQNSYKLTMTCDNKIDDSIKILKDDSNDEILEMSKYLSNQESSKSVLHIESQKNKETFTSSVIVASNNGIVERGQTYAAALQKVTLIPAIGRLGGEDLAQIYSLAELGERHKPVIELLKAFDSEIESVRVFNNTGKSLLNVRRKGEPFMLLSAFGDAMNRMVDLFLRIMNNENGIVLIDEIENGVHYTKHEAIWSLIFALADSNNVQIFATTHSKEMMQSFDNVARKNNNVAAKYIEVFKSARTNNIKSNVFDAEKLKYALSQNESLRGESL